jgi:hypothetical protein
MREGVIIEEKTAAATTEVVPPEIDRRHMLDTIVGALSERVPVLFLEGDEGSGATTTLTQLSKLLGGNCFTLFIKPASRLAYNIEYLKYELSEQFRRALKLPNPSDEASATMDWTKLVISIRKLIAKSPVYFIVDGLHQIPADEAASVAAIFRDVLPVGVKGFRFVITGDQSTFARYLSGISSKPYQQLVFALGEAKQYLDGLDLSDSQLESLYKVAKGLPGNLAAVRRLLISGTPYAQVVGLEAKTLPEFVRHEMRSLLSLTDELKKLLAVIAFGRQHLNSEVLSEIVLVPAIEVQSLLSACPYLTNSSEQSGIEFRSEAHRRYAEEVLEPYRRQAIQLQLAYFQKNPSSSTAVRFMPTFLEQIGKAKELLGYLGPDHYEALLRETGSILALRSRAQMGIRHASELRQLTDVLKYAFQKSVFNAAATDDCRTAEVAALVALGDVETALSIASRGASVEMRLKLLCRYARQARLTYGRVDDAVRAHINDFIKKIDFSLLPELAVELATDLVLVDTDLAFALVETATTSQVDDSMRDAAYARMAMTASLSGPGDERKVDEQSRRKIRDEKLYQTVAALASLLAEASSARILEDARGMEGRRRVFFLRQVCAYKPSREGALDIVDFALHSMTSDVLYRPTMDDLADLAKPLSRRAVAERERVLQLVRQIETQVGLIEGVSPTRTLVTLRMRLARAEYLIDRALGSEKIIGAYLDLTSQPTLEGRLDGLAIMLRFLNQIDVDGVLEEAHGIRRVVQNDLSALVDQIFAETADHLEIVKNALTSIASFDVAEAIKLVERINLLPRRTEAYKIVLASFAKREFGSQLIPKLYQIKSRLVMPDDLDDAIRTFVDNLKYNSNRNSWFAEATKLVGTMAEAEIATTCTLDLIELQDESAIVTYGLAATDRLNELIPKVDCGPVRIDLYFRAAQVFAKVDETTARTFLEQAYAEMDLPGGHTDQFVSTIATSVRLVTRAAESLVKHNLLSDDHVSRISNMVESIPVGGVRAHLYAELALRGWLVSKGDFAKAIVQRYILPIVVDGRSTTLSCVFPAIYLTQPAIAIQLLSGLDAGRADDCLGAAVDVLLRRCVPSDPIWREDFVRYKNEWEEIEKAIDLLGRIKTDYYIYDVVSNLACALTAEGNRYKFTVQQKNSVAARIEALIEEKLPDKDNIQHDGYKILCAAQCARIRGMSKGSAEEYIAQVMAIKNVSDRVFMLTELARALPNKLSEVRSDVYPLAMSEILCIPSTYDQCNRYEVLAKAACSNSPAISSQAVRKAMLASDSLEPEAAYATRRNLIDIADRTKDGLAEELLKNMDDDPARARARAQVKRAIDISRAKNELDSLNSEHLDPGVRKYISEAAWRNFESALNYRTPHRPNDRMLGALQVSSDLDVEKIYPVLAWYVENLRQRFQTFDDVSREILPVFEALLLTTELASNVLVEYQQRMRLSASPSSSTGMFVAPRDRHAALQFIAQWLRGDSSGSYVICDPYFGPDGVDFLQLLACERPNAKISVLTSIQHGKVFVDADGNPYLSAWRRSYDGDPPETEVIGIGREGLDQPLVVHDRWLLGESRGLRLGTSVNSIGEGKLSEISHMDCQDCGNCMTKLRPFLSRHRVVGGERIQYATLSL